MASAAATVDSENPWPGLASYDEAAQGYFSGRGAEIAELVRRISDEAVTVLFGKSGLGKSSFLKAGVFPELRRRGLLPVPVRLHFGVDAIDAVEQMASAMFAAFDAEQVEYPARVAGETLWDYLHRAGLRFWTKKVRPVQPVLVLDQFEEIFTVGRGVTGVADALRERLADLGENRIPAELAARVEAGDSLPATLDVHAQPYKLVLSLREDFLPDLEGWLAAMPSLRRNRMRLLPLQREQAMQAVCNARTEHLVDAALARRIVDYLASGAATREAGDGQANDAGVEPALLSLLCRGINEARKREGKARFDEAQFEAGKGRIVADFYCESLADQPPRVARFIEDELVTDQGFRNSYSVVAATQLGRIQRAEIAALVDRRLLRIEHHLGTERVELTHDLLTRAALERRFERRAAERSAAQRQWIGRVGAAALAVLAVTGFLIWQRVDRLQSERATAEANAKNDRDRLDEIRRANDQLVKAQADVVEAQKTLEKRNLALLSAYTDIAKASGEAKAEAGRANQERARAEQLTLLARSREIAARAQAVMASDRELAVLLGAAALRIADTPEARAALLDAARYVWPTTVLAPDRLGGPPRLVGLDARGRQLVVVAETGGQGTLGIWDLETRAPKNARWQRVLDSASVGFVTFTPEGRRLLVARPDRIEQLDVQTGDPAAPPIELPPGARQLPPAQLALSADGHWLAAAMRSGAALVRDLRDPGGAWETAAVDGAVAISISDDGQRLATVGDGPLRAAVVVRDAAGRWASRPLDVTACAKPDSVATAAAYAVATWRAQACAQSLDPGAEPDSTPTRDDEPAVADTVASAFGPAFAAILANGDLKVGTGDPSRPDSASDIKGVRLTPSGSMLSSLSVNASGTRVAWLDTDGVRVVSLAGYKLLLSEYPGGAIVSDDGHRVVQARALRGGAVAWMTRVEAVSEGRELPRPAWRLEPPPPHLPEKMEVHGNAVFITARPGEGQDLATTVHDLDTGSVRAGPFAGDASAAGGDGQLLLVHSPRRAQQPAEAQLVRLTDGRVLGRWPETGVQRVTVSPGGAALLVVRPAENQPRMLAAQAFALHAGQLVPAGRVVDLPGTAARSGIDDAATVLTEQRTIPFTDPDGTRRPRGVTLHWPLSPGRETSARDPAKALAPEIRSPSGRFAWRQLRQPDGSSATMLMRRDDGRVLHRYSSSENEFPAPSFSADEHWFAFVEEGTVHVLDLRTLQPVLNWRVKARSANFSRDGGLLRIELTNGAALLVPTDRALVDGFARWLVTRELTSAERCLHGLDTASCGSEMAPIARRR